MKLVPVVKPDIVGLTRCESETLKGVALGMSVKADALRRKREASTVKTQRQSMMRKFGAENVQMALAIAFAIGVLEYNEIPDTIEPSLTISRHFKNFVVAMLLAVTSLGSVFPDISYADQLVDEETQNLEFVRLSSRPPEEILLRHNRKRKRLGLDKKQGFDIAER